jgi:hypothetical protein
MIKRAIPRLARALSCRISRQVVLSDADRADKSSAVTGAAQAHVARHASIATRRIV